MWGLVLTFEKEIIVTFCLIMKAFALQHFSLRVSDFVDLPFVQPWYRDNLRLPKHTRAPITRVARQGSSIPFIQLMQDRIGSGESGREAFSCRESRNDIISPLIANDVSIRVWGGDREETRGREREREKERERERERERETESKKRSEENTLARVYTCVEQRGQVTSKH